MIQIGVVLSTKESFFSFKENKIVIRLKTPVFQVVMQAQGLTCTSKKIELYIAENLKDIEAKIMGKSYDLLQMKSDFTDLHSKLWISTQVDSGDINQKMEGIAQTSEGKVIFVNQVENLAAGYELILRHANQQIIANKNIIKEYCSKNIELLNNQIRILTSDKVMYMDLANKL